MDLNMLFENYALLMDSPNSTAKIRELILQLAVQGKLAPQDPTDEPAGELLKRIKSEKEKLITEGKIKKQKPLPPITEDDIPYELPQGWEWVRLDDICSYIQRGKGPKYIDNSEFPVVSQKCIQWHGFQIEKARFIDPASLNKYAKERFLQTGDLLWNSTGTGTIGRLCVYIHDDNSYDKVVADSHVTIVRPIRINSEHLFNFLASPTIQDGFEDRASGTTNQIELATSTVKNQVIPLAPLTEQKRIVAKVDQLMQLCDQLDACQEKASKKYTSLNDAALEKLSSSKTVDEFAGHWQFLCNNLDLMYNDPAHVNKLRQAILQLAVQGKLTPQDVTDEPASELLKRIKTEKEKLITEGKIRKQKPFPPITEDEIPYELPQDWEWVRLGELSTFLGGYAFKSHTYVKSSKNQVIRLGNVKNSGLLLDQNPVFVSDDIANDKKEYLLEEGDLLITMTGTRAKRDYLFVTLVKNYHLNRINLYLNQRVGCLRFFEPLYIELFEKFLKADNLLDNLFSIATGTANQANIGAKALKEFVFPLPPLAEQKRIVAKVDQLMQLCDELETRLTQSKKDSEMLMHAVLSEALGTS